MENLGDCGKHPRRLSGSKKVPCAKCEWPAGRSSPRLSLLRGLACDDSRAGRFAGATDFQGAKRKQFVEALPCQIVLFHPGGPERSLVSIELADKPVEVGSQVSGPGRLDFPGLASRHAKLWRDKSGNWLKAIDGRAIWLNSVPVSRRARTKLVKGDSLVFGKSPRGPEFWVLCRRAQELEGNDLTASTAGPDLRNDLETEEGGWATLSRAEYDVLAWMARGVVEAEDIARHLFRSVNTVRTQLSKIYEKTGVYSRTELLGLLIRYGQAVDREKRDVSQWMGECACSPRPATGDWGSLLGSRRQPAGSR